MAKKIVLATLSLLALCASLFLDYQLQAKAISVSDSAVVSVLDSAFSPTNSVPLGARFVYKNNFYEAAAPTNSRLTLQFLNTGIMRLAPEASVRFRVDPATPALKFENLTGRVWLNTINSSIETQLKTPSSIIYAEQGVFDFQAGKGVTVAAALRHGAEVKFLEKKVSLPEGNQLVVADSKIQKSAETIKKLRYSKLLKEFPYAPIVVPYDTWTRTNLADDATQREIYREKSEDFIRRKGAAGAIDDTSAVSAFRNGIFDISQALTLDPERKEKRLIDGVFDYFDAALFARLVGKEQSAQQLINQFGLLEQTLRVEISDQTLVDAARDARLWLVEFANPEDKLFDAKRALRNSAKPPAFTLIHYAANDLLDSLENAPDGRASSAGLGMMRAFNATVDLNLKQAISGNERPELFFEALRLNNFIRRHPVLAQEQFLKRVSMIEQAHMGTLAGREALSDEKQLFMSEKLAHVDSLRAQISTDKVSFEDGRNAMLFLVNEIDELKPSISDTAFLTDVDRTLAALTPLIAFLHSSRAENFHGSFDGNFKQFSQDAEQQRLIAELLAQSTGGEQISTFRREELAGTVAQALSKIGFTKVKLELPAVENDPSVKIISAEFEGKSVTGVYNTARKVFSNVVFGGETIGPSIRDENIRKFLLIKMGKLTLAQGKTIDSLVEPQRNESTLERLAKAAILEDFKKLDIEVKDENVDLKDFNSGIVHVRLANYGEGPDKAVPQQFGLVFSFDVEFKTRTVRSLRVQTVSGEIPVNDTFALSDLTARVLQIVKRAEFEKTRDEELKKSGQAK